MSLGTALQLNFSVLKKLFPDLYEGLSIRDFLFLDTETTGLSGGAGTVAFLIGLGFFDDDSYVQQQYFIRDYDEEAAMLTAVNVQLASRKGLVTFNGKGFDWNLLLSRFACNRIKPAMKYPLHMDLLFPSRRIWKMKLESCRLVSLEENILGEYRVDDIPGALIPYAYFRYLETRDASEMVKVIAHNAEDIISMVSLLSVISSKLESPYSNADGDELFGLGKIFENSGEYEMVVKCFEACAGSEHSKAREAAVRKLSGLYKRMGDYTRAVEHWETLLKEKNLVNVFPLVELAKYYEHKEKNAEKALEMVEKAIRITLQTGLLESNQMYELKKRQQRLRRKTGRIING